MIGRIGSAFVVLLALACPLAAQDERWQLTLDGDQYVWDIRLVRLDGEALVVRQSDSLRRVPVAHITEVRLIRKSEMSLGDGGGAGVMSALTGADDEVYDLTALDTPERLRTVQKILQLHPAEP
jgi:hypothetical protein